MSTVLDRTFNGATISQRETDGYFNATAMCQANKKQWNDYWRLSSTTAYLDALSESTGIPVDSLVESRPGQPARGGGTWVHPDIAIHLAQWCNPRFAVLVTGWVRELLTKGVVAVSEHELDELDILAGAVRRLQDLRDAQRATDGRVDVVEERVTVVERVAGAAHRLADAATRNAQSNFGWFTVLAYCKRTGRDIPVEESARHGRELTAELRAAGDRPRSVTDPRFGVVNTYPEWLLARHFGDDAAIVA